MSKNAKQYREWVRNRASVIHKDDTNDKYKDRKWRINQNHIRETIIEEYNESGYRPEFLITRNYY